MSEGVGAHEGEGFLDDAVVFDGGHMNGAKSTQPTFSEVPTE